MRDSYIELNAVFPPLRYGPMKRLIKTAATEENIKNLRQWVEESKEEKSEEENLGEGSTEGFLQETDRILGEIEKMQEAEESNERPLLSGGPPLSICGQAVRKIQKIIGFDSDPIEDEDVMDNERLIQKIKKMERSIHGHQLQLQTALDALLKLRSEYNSSKGRIFMTRYIDMKAMVRRVIAQTNAETSYEDRKSKKERKREIGRIKERYGRRSKAKEGKAKKSG